MPSLSCAEPLPVDEQCSCTCRDGAKFNQTRPDFTGSIPITPSLGDGEKMEGKPCTTDIIHPWIELSLPRNANTLEPSTISSNTIDNPEDSILLVADSRQRCQNFVVYIDDVRVGVTSGEGALDGTWCGTGEECIENHGGSHAYFKLLQGKRFLLYNISMILVLTFYASSSRTTQDWSSMGRCSGGIR